MSKLNINEQEKNRIKNLHKSYFLKEQDINVEIDPVVVDPGNPISDPRSPIGDPLTPVFGDDPILQADNNVKQPPRAPSNVPCAQIYNQVQTVAALPYWVDALQNGLIPGICSKCETHYQSWVSMGSPMPVPQGTDWYSYGSAGQQVCLLLINNPQCCNPTSTEHECVNGNCVQQAGGQFPDLASCQNSGCGDVYCINCPQGQMTMGPGGVCPQGYVIAPGTPGVTQPTPVCYECVNGNCTGPSWASGPQVFNSQNDCQTSPICSPPTNHECVNGSCVADPNGQYPTLADCQASGCGQGSSYNCTDWASPTGCQQVQGGGGQFPTLDDCLISPCQCDSIIQSWPFYTNNPNNPQGNWNGSPHDGPSNPNALNNILGQVQSSNAYNSNNVTQRQKARCKEAAIQFWLANSTNVACCSQAQWGNNPVASGGNGDPLGCVTQNYVNLINNNFIPNSPNWPGQGCNWLQNAVNNTLASQAAFPPSSIAYCKYQGKINFLQNLMNTGQSNYINGNVSFTPPC